MDIRQLRHFMAVAETLHFGKAAERLFMTQPPLSQSIMALERNLGASLFHRTKRSVVLTAFGQQWLDYVREALKKIDGLDNIAHQLRQGFTGKLELSFISTAVYNFLPLLVNRFRDAYPGVELLLTELTSERQIVALCEGNGDAGIVIHSPESVLPSSLIYQPLTSEPLIAALPASWVADQRVKIFQGQVCQQDIITSPLVIFPRQAAPNYYDLVMRYYAECGGIAHITQHAIQMQTIISLVSAGMGIALVPASMRQLAREGVYYCKLSGPAPQLETGLIYRRNEDRPILTNLLAVIAGIDIETE